MGIFPVIRTPRKVSTMISSSESQKIALEKLRISAQDIERVSGLTHTHYKYPARFSPKFVSTAISCFSNPGDLVLDPYMGGGTTIVEAIANQRRAVGCDINSLAVFVTKVKCTPLDKRSIDAVRRWAELAIPSLSYRTPAPLVDESYRARMGNLHLPKARALKKLIALSLNEIELLPSNQARDFARCALLNVSQWALNGKKRSATMGEFRDRLTSTTLEMLCATEDFSSAHSSTLRHEPPVLIHDSAENLAGYDCFSSNALADLVVTSPPYPGVHMLYHRWQVDGRKETAAPYWIANCLDGQGASYYNFGARKQEGLTDYFDSSLRTLAAIRAVMRKGGVFVQMIAFSDPATQLRRYLRNMHLAGFSEVKSTDGRIPRIWRNVPNRSWHASLQGSTTSAREVALIHVAE
jgi:DNA modification methylase